MVAVMAILAAMILWKGKVAGFGKFHVEYCSPEKTNAVKGIFVLAVFLSHMRGYTRLSALDLLALSPVTFLGQLMVAPFLFYSGYGVMESIRKKGISYVHRIPVQRVAKTLLHFDLAVLVFLLVCYLTDNRVSLSQLLLSLIGWESIGNSNWYVFVVLLLYLITWLSFLCCREKAYLGAVFVTVLSAASVVMLALWRDSWWHDTLLCYCLGMWFSLLRKPLEKILLHNDAVWLLSVAGTLIVFLCLRQRTYLFPYMSHILALIFMVLLVLVSAKVSLDNPFLQFLGKHTFWLYILQRIPMILLSHYCIWTSRPGIFFVASFVVTCLLAVLFERITKQLDKLLVA